MDKYQRLPVSSSKKKKPFQNDCFKGIDSALYKIENIFSFSLKTMIETELRSVRKH